MWKDPRTVFRSRKSAKKDAILSGEGDFLQPGNCPFVHVVHGRTDCNRRAGRKTHIAEGISLDDAQRIYGSQ
ncbi:MAG: hypothetical protein ACYCYP_13795 [Leptospirales bacterium]